MAVISKCADEQCDDTLPCEACAADYLSEHRPEVLDSPLWNTYGAENRRTAYAEAQRDLPTGGGTGTGQGGSARTNLASDKQLAFIARLADERGLTVDTTSMSKDRASAEIERLMALPKKGPEYARWKKHGSGRWGIFAPGHTVGDTVEVKKSSGEIQTITLGGMMGTDIYAPGEQAPAKAAAGFSVTEPGMYATDDDRIVKVQLSQAGRLYGKVLTGTSFEYEPGAMRDITRKLTLAEAQAYGKRTGQCCCCGRELTNPDSIAAGIGPICASRL